MLSGGRTRSLSDPETIRAFVHNLREGICVATLSGEILDANPAFLELFGVRSLEELHETEATSGLFTDPDEWERESALLAADGVVRGFELHVRRPDGEVRTALVTAYRVRDDSTGDVLQHAILVDISERKYLENQLLEQALRDPLTGCYNRRFLTQLALKLEASPDPWGAIVIDLDGFKLLNDEHGHEAGDRELVAISRFLMRRTRADEAVVRLGGDEFLLLLSGASEVTTEAVADRLRLAASREDLAAFSLGWAARDPQESLLSTIDRADQKLLLVKRSDRVPVRRRRELRSAGAV